MTLYGETSEKWRFTPFNYKIKVKGVIYFTPEYFNLELNRSLMRVRLERPNSLRVQGSLCFKLTLYYQFLAFLNA